MMFKNLFTALVVSMAAAAATPAQATAITVGDGWHFFNFGDVGSSWDQDFTFTLSKPAYLKVTDFLNPGDQFDVTGLGLTSLPTASSDLINEGNPDVAFSDPAGRWSHGLFLLLPGIYDIAGTVVLSPFHVGSGAIELAAVPLPAALPLFGAAMAGLGVIGRRRRNRAAA